LERYTAEALLVTGLVALPVAVALLGYGRAPDNTASVLESAVQNKGIQPAASQPRPTLPAKGNPAQGSAQNTAQNAAQPPARPSGAPAGQNSSGVYRMKLARLIDQHGFERPLTAMSLLIPTDWQFQGDVQYVKGGACGLTTTGFQTQGPDGRAMEMFPEFIWNWADDPQTVQLMQMSRQQQAQFGARGCDIMPTFPPAEFLRRVALPKLRPNARVIGLEPTPKLSQQIAGLAAQQEAQARQVGLQARVRGDAARVRIAYMVNGQQVEEWLVAMSLSTATPTPTFNTQTMQQGTTFSYNNWARVVALRAPAGKLDASENMFELMRSTVRVDPNWQARIQGVQNNISAAQIKGAADRSKIIAKSNADISNIITQGYNQRQATMDRISEDRSQTMRGVETFRNPSTGDSFELPSQYQHAWINQQNEYILSDSPNFDPNQALKSGNWTELQRARR
jgi:hypothetical protein